MTYERLKQLKPSTFKRRCGVHRETFYQMASVLRPHLNRQGKRGGQCKLGVEDQLLVALEYWRDAPKGTPPNSTSLKLGVSVNQQSVALSKKWKLC